jgi:SHS2 domain-containing protein
MQGPVDLPVPGVRALDHTADVGIEVAAASYPELLRRAALGLTWLLLERHASGLTEERALQVQTYTHASLLRDVLRELLWWHDSEGLCTVDLVDIHVARSKRGLVFSGTARLVRHRGMPVREIKGVTMHGLTAERSPDGWYARVLFDV